MKMIWMVMKDEDTYIRKENPDAKVAHKLETTCKYEELACMKRS